MIANVELLCIHSGVNKALARYPAGSPNGVLPNGISPNGVSPKQYKHGNLPKRRFAEWRFAETAFRRKPSSSNGFRLG
jgi:hypothetical protein